MEDYLELSAYRKVVSWFPSINCKLNTASWQSFTFIFLYEFQMEKFSSIHGEFAFRTEVLQDLILFSHLCKPSASHDRTIHSGFLSKLLFGHTSVFLVHKIMVEGNVVFEEITSFLLLCSFVGGCHLSSVLDFCQPFEFVAQIYLLWCRCRCLICSRLICSPCYSC